MSSTVYARVSPEAKAWLDEQHRNTGIPIARLIDTILLDAARCRRDAMKAFIPVWESHLAEREARDGKYDPQWWIHPDAILRLRKYGPYQEYMIETRDNLVYFTHRETWEQLVTGAA